MPNCDPIVVTQSVREGLAALAAGDWDAAHACAQRHEGAPLADWLHAVLHRIEGDESNARYWYASAGKSADAFSDPHQEAQAIAAALP